MSKLLIAALSLLIAGNTYLAWHLYSHIEPTTAQLDADLAALREQRASLVQGNSQMVESGMLDAILGQTEAMLQQKRAAIVRFVNLDYVVNGRRVDDSSNGDLEKISAEIIAQKKQVSQAKAEADKYSGGLIRSVLELRLAVDELTLALLEQKKTTLTYGMALPLLRRQPPPVDSDALTKVEEEIMQKRNAIGIAEREAQRYSGGLVLATLLARIETERLALAMLDQRRLSLKYQMGLPVLGDALSSRETVSKTPGKAVGDKEALQ